jgi:hypothetical protein
MAEIARLGQAIYLTHHGDVAAAARAAGARVHFLLGVPDADRRRRAAA